MSSAFNEPDATENNESFGVENIQQYRSQLPADFVFNQHGNNLRALEPRPPLTFNSNNGKLAFVDGSGYLHLSIVSDRNNNALKRAGYTPATWGVPGSSNEDPDYRDWCSKMRPFENFRDADRRAEVLPVPDIPQFGLFGASHNELPGEFVVSDDQKTISWFCVNLPSPGGKKSGVILSPNTPDVLQKLINAGYQPGTWPCLNIANAAKKTRGEFAKWLSAITT